MCTFCMSVIHFHYFAFFVWVLYTFLILSTSACILEIVQHIFCCSMLYTRLRSPLSYTFIITLSREKVKCTVKYMYSMAIPLHVWSIRRNLMCIGIEQYCMRVGLFKHYLKNRLFLYQLHYFCWKQIFRCWNSNIYLLFLSTCPPRWNNQNPKRFVKI